MSASGLSGAAPRPPSSATANSSSNAGAGGDLTSPYSAGPGAMGYSFNVSYASQPAGGSFIAASSLNNNNNSVASPSSATSSLGGSGMGVAEKSDEDMARLTEAMYRMMSSDSVARIPSPGHALPSPIHPASSHAEFPDVPPDDILKQSDPEMVDGTRQPGQLDDNTNRAANTNNNNNNNNQNKGFTHHHNQPQIQFQPIVAPQRRNSSDDDHHHHHHHQHVHNNNNNNNFQHQHQHQHQHQQQFAHHHHHHHHNNNNVAVVAMAPSPPVFKFGEREYYGYGVTGRWGRDRGTHLFTQLTLTDGRKVFCNSLRLRVKPEWFDSIQSHQTQFEVFFHSAPNLNHANQMLTCLDAWPSNCLVDVIGLMYTPQIGFLEVTAGLVNKLMHGAPLVMCTHMLDPHNCPHGFRCTQGHIRPIWLDHHNAGTAAAIASNTGQSPSVSSAVSTSAAAAAAAANNNNNNIISTIGGGYGIAVTSTLGGAVVVGGGHVSGGTTPKLTGEAGPTTSVVPPIMTGTTASGVMTVGGLVVSTGTPKAKTATSGSTTPTLGGVPGGGATTPPASLTPRAAAAASAAQSVVSVLNINGVTYAPPMRWSLVGGGPSGTGGYQVATSISYRLEEWARADGTRRLCGHGVSSGWQLDSKGVPFTFVEMGNPSSAGRVSYPLVVFMTSGRLVGGPEAAMAGALSKDTPPFEVFAMVTPNLRDPNRMTVIHGCAADSTRVRIASSPNSSDMVAVSLLEYTEGLLAVLLAEPGTAPYPPFAWCSNDNLLENRMCPLGNACKMAHRRRGQLVVG